MSTKVNPSQFSETVRHSIRVNGALDGTYVAMNTLATMIACYGLFENSPAVIIGAMIVAMLIGPIAAVGLALVDSDTPLLRKSLMALAGGVCGVMLTAFILGWLHRDVPITDEIMARTAPNFMDLMIALAGGAAGAVACHHAAYQYGVRRRRDRDCVGAAPFIGQSALGPRRVSIGRRRLFAGLRQYGRHPIRFFGCPLAERFPTRLNAGEAPTGNVS